MFISGSQFLFPPIASAREKLLLIRGNRPIPAKMPLPDACRSVARLLRQSPDGEPFRRDHGRSPKSDNPRLQSGPPVIATGQESVAGGRANPGRRVSVGKSHPSGSETIDVRRRDFSPLRIVTPNISISQIVGVDHHDVWLRWGSSQERNETAKQHDKSKD